MRFPGFIGPSYTLQSVNVDCQRCMNLYPQLNELGTGKEREVASLVSTPGLELLVTLPTSPYRGSYTGSDGTLYAVGGNVLYSVSSLWEPTALGTLSTDSGPVSMADNGIHVMLVDGSFGYVYTIASSAFALVTDPDFPGATQVVFQDGYFIFIRPGTEEFFISGINDVTFDGLDIARAEGSPDNLVGEMNDGQVTYMFGEYSTEVFYNSGNADFPFERVQGALMGVGCAAAFSIQDVGGVPYWLGRTKQGRGIVYRAQGYKPERISTHAIENVIQGLGNVSSARAWTYEQSGHQFYCLNLPGASTTWVFDVSTGLWHERSYLAEGVDQRHRAEGHSFAYDTNVVGDYESGNLYALKPDVYSDNGSDIVRERTSPHVSKDGNLHAHYRFQLDMETGVGLDGGAEGSDPQVTLQWSDDGGHTWSSERSTSAGEIGDRRVKVEFRRLGSTRDRVYRTRVTSQVKVTMIGANLDIEEGIA